MRLALFLVLTCFSPVVFAQNAGRNTMTLGAGGGFPASGDRIDQFSDGPAISANYEFRLFKVLAPEIGVVNLVPNATSYSSSGSSTARYRVTLLTMGARGILPLISGRAELFATTGAAHLSSSNTDLTQGFHSPNWLWEFGAGGRIAADRHRRFWIGPELRWFRDTGRPTEQWASLTADFAFRF